MSFAIFFVSIKFLANPFFGWSIFNFKSVSLNLSLSSAKSIASVVVPKIFTPSLYNSLAILRGVWAPNCT